MGDGLSKKGETILFLGPHTYNNNHKLLKIKIYYFTAATLRAKKNLSALS